MIELYENCRKNLKSLVDWYSDNKQKRNEATTRLHLINEFLINCLGWEKQNITAEDSYGNQYTDYTISLTRPLLILEAKKEGDYFELPEGVDDLVYPIKTLCRDNKNLKMAIEQVCDYCQTRGVQIGAVSNGWQLVALIANRVDGIPPMEGNAYVFRTLELMDENFLELWNILSKAGLDRKIIIKRLIGELIPNLPPKLSSTIYNYPGVKNRNSFQTDMQILSDLVLEDIVREKEVEKEFLLACYCKSGALSQYALITKEILKTRYEYLFETGDKKASVSQPVDKKGVTRDFAEVLASSLSIRPILLIGDVGVGKTTFTENLIKIEAESILEHAITFVIDLGSQAILSQDLRTSIIDEIYKQFIQEYSLNIEEGSSEYVNNFETPLIRI
jgi:hypothetical protein